MAEHCRCVGNYCGGINVPTGKVVRRRIVGAAPEGKPLTSEQKELVDEAVERIKEALDDR